MTKWMIWFDDEKSTVGLYQSEQGLSFVGDFLLEEIAAKTGDEPLIGFFPTEHVSFIQAHLPKTSDKKIRLALPSLVEDSIASNLEENFYVLPTSYQAGQSCQVVVTSIKYIENLIKQIQVAGLHLQSLAPDCFLMKAPSEGVNKLIMGDRVVVRSAAEQGFAMDKQHAVLIMQELDIVPVSEPALFEDAPFNMLQAQFAVKSSKKKFGKKHIMASIIAGAVTLHLVSLMIMGAILNHRLDLLKEKSLELYAQVFPGAIKVSSPKSLIERELKNTMSRSNDPFVDLVTTASQALSNIAGAGLEKMDYSQNGLTLQLILPNMESLDHLSAFKQQQVTEQGNTVLVDILISPGESS